MPKWPAPGIKTSLGSVKYFPPWPWKILFGIQRQKFAFYGKEYSETALVCQRKRVAICGIFGTEISHCQWCYHLGLELLIIAGRKIAMLKPVT